MLAILTRLAGFLPAGLRHHATPARLVLFAQIAAFGCTGLFGLVLDIATVYALRGALGLYLAGILAYFVAATGNWALNRVWTFRGQGDDPAHRQWAKFLIVNLAGLVLNRGTYALLITFIPACAAEPAYAVAAGALAGMGVNFILTRRLVFGPDLRPDPPK
jgi:putative flippase GtrA